MPFGIKDIIDIALVALILFGFYRLLRRSGASNLFWGLIAFIFAWLLVAYVFELELTGALFQQVVSVGAIALIVIFQEELRAFFYRLGDKFNFEKLAKHHAGNARQDQAEAYVHQLMTAITHMSASKTGALIILADKQGLKEYADTGEIVDAAISARMIENIFFKNTPLHDGALIITNGRLLSAACILPISKRQDISTQYGLRHRAALGIAEKTDVTAIVVSEETGHISVAKGNIIISVGLTELEQFYLRPAFGITTYHIKNDNYSTL